MICLLARNGRGDVLSVTRCGRYPTRGQVEAWTTDFFHVTCDRCINTLADWEANLIGRSQWEVDMNIYQTALVALNELYSLINDDLCDEVKDVKEKQARIELVIQCAKIADYFESSGYDRSLIKMKIEDAEKRRDEMKRNMGDE